MAELLPCPFCGGEAGLYTWHKSWVSHDCNVIGGCIYVREYDTEAEAIDAWNTRYHCGLDDEDYSILLDELGLSERTCHLVEDDGLFHCSNCGGVASKQSWAYWKFCPNCGAKVVGE